jgi:hypothetical protein
MTKRQLKLRNIPEDIYCILLQEQAKIKAVKKIGMFGMERTLYAIIREHRRCEEIKNTFSR